jgi:hypothetical protein
MSEDDAEEAVWNQYADRYRAANVRSPSERRADTPPAPRVPWS